MRLFLRERPKVQAERAGSDQGNILIDLIKNSIESRLSALDVRFRG